MDEICERLKTASDSCVKAYESWSKDKKDGDSREKLQETIHELRKVASRLEIDLAISERDEMAQKPIPIPAHRSQNKAAQGSENEGSGNILDGNTNPPKPHSRPPAKIQRRRTPRKSSGN